MLKPKGKLSTQISLAEQDALLEPYTSDLAAYVELLCAVGRQEYLLALEEVHGKLHGEPGVDHEMLDQAVEFHSHKDPDDPDGPPVVYD